MLVRPWSRGGDGCLLRKGGLQRSEAFVNAEGCSGATRWSEPTRCQWKLEGSENAWTQRRAPPRPEHAAAVLAGPRNVQPLLLSRFSLLSTLQCCPARRRQPRQPFVD